jgi:hypothetical protein
MTSPPSKSPSFTVNDTSVDDETLPPRTATPSRASIRKSRSISSTDKHAAELEKLSPGPVSEKALEAGAAPPTFDESKILQGRKLFFAFVAMLLSVLLIALGASNSLQNLSEFLHSPSSDQTIIAPAL